MIHIGNLDQLQLPALLERIQLHQKTGKVIVTCKDVQEEIYIDRGHVITVSSRYDKEPLLRRLIRSEVISPGDLKRVPANIGQIISQPQGDKHYSDVQIAKVLLKLGIVNSEQLANWVQQENTKAVLHILNQLNGQIYFEEGVQLPPDHLYVYLKAETSISPAIYEAKSTKSNAAIESSMVPTTPLPIFLEKSYSTFDEKLVPTTPLPTFLEKSYSTFDEKLVPLTPSGFVKLLGTIGRTLAIPAIQAAQAVVQRTAAAIRPYFPIDDTLTERVPTPPKPNPLFQWETLLIIAVLLIAGLAHGINMFHYPYFEDDEGTYLSQAWAVIHLGKLGYYTYWYDHAPGGWIQIAFWAVLTGGFHTFGIAMNSGRIFMLLIQLGSTFILYRIARIVSSSMLVATIVALLFALSPYGLYFHRRILLDNFMTFWMLLSILPLLSSRLTLRRVWFSAVALAISILSKEVTVFIIPVLAYMVWTRTDKMHRTFAFIGWLTLLCTIVSLYPLLALIKGEFFPSGTFLGGQNPHVSLLSSVLYQGSRVHDGGILNPNSLTRLKINEWIQDDFILTVIGSFCAIISMFLIKTKKHSLIGAMGAITLFLWVFIIRGGVVLDFYFIPLLPLLALNIGLVIGIVIDYGAKLFHSVSGMNPKIFRIIERCLIISCLIGGFATYIAPGTQIGFGSSNLGDSNNTFVYWTSTQADTHTEAVQWVVTHHLPKNSRIVIDQSMWPDLYYDGYTLSHYYWKIMLDPAIGGQIFHYNWRNFDYIITTPQMMNDIRIANMVLLKEALQHSVPIASFKVGKYVVEIRKVNK